MANAVLGACAPKSNRPRWDERTTIHVNIRILGNGGAVNDGLPYNAFIINDTLLSEAPPDIMLSLRRNGVEPSSIRTIYISHLHGDHIFGLPFLVLSAFFQDAKTESHPSFTVVGPAGTKETAEQLVACAFTPHHPCCEWMKSNCIFEEVDRSSRPVLVEGYQTSLFKLDHLVETYGFSLMNRQGEMEFAYVADTRWCEAVGTVLSARPRIVFIDLNGQDNDPHPVHLSLGELMQKAVPITGEQTIYFGTHLAEAFTDPAPNVRCTEPGMVIQLGKNDIRVDR
jgi:hypothetical protein